jgi:hypothetical protein
MVGKPHNLLNALSHINGGGLVPAKALKHPLKHYFPILCTPIFPHCMRARPSVGGFLVLVGLLEDWKARSNVLRFPHR